MRNDARQPDDPTLLTIAQAAKETTLSERTLWRHIDKGALPVQRIGPFERPRIRRADLDAYMRNEPLAPAAATRRAAR